MSANLMMRPAYKGTSLPDALKYVLHDRIKGGYVVFGEGDLEYLKGLRDGGVDGATQLIEAVEKYDSVELFLLY